MNETKFIKQLKDTFLAMAADEEREEPVIWKLRGSASTAGRPDLLVVDAGKVFFIEAKVAKGKLRVDLMEPVTNLQRTNLESIVATGGNAFIATMFERPKGKVNKYGIVLILHEMIDDELKLPQTLFIESKRNDEGELTFTLPKHSFIIMQKRTKWMNTEFFRGNCVD